MKGVTDDSSADFEYYNWVVQFNTLGLRDNIPIVNGTLGLTGSVSSQYENVGGDGCTISDGVLLERA